MAPPFSRPELDRRGRTDPHNRDFLIRPVVAGTPHQKVLWKTSERIPLNQRTDGGSVAYGWASMMEQVDPVNFPATGHAVDLIGGGARQDDMQELEPLVRKVYVGSSLLGGARYLKRAGFITGYHWAETADDVITTLCAYGPVLLGVSWFDAMYEPLPNGVLEVNGPQVGGHCLLATGYIPGEEAMKMGLGHANLVQVVPSLGRGYGVGGRAYLRLMDLHFLMKNGGEAVVPDNMQATEILTGMRAFAARPIVRRMTSPFRRD
jgi:hypothetical protein